MYQLEKHKYEQLLVCHKHNSVIKLTYLAFINMFEQYGSIMLVGGHCVKSSSWYISTNRDGWIIHPNNGRPSDCVSNTY